MQCSLHSAVSALCYMGPQKLKSMTAFKSGEVDFSPKMESEMVFSRAPSACARERRVAALFPAGSLHRIKRNFFVARIHSE